MSREAETMQTLKNIGDVSKTQAILADIAISLAQIADKIGCDYEVHTEFVADNDKQARMVTVYHRRERK